MSDTVPRDGYPISTRISLDALREYRDRARAQGRDIRDVVASVLERDAAKRSVRRRRTRAEQVA